MHEVESEGIEPSSEQVHHNGFYMLSGCYLSGASGSATYLRRSVYALQFRHSITYLLQLVLQVDVSGANPVELRTSETLTT